MLNRPETPEQRLERYREARRHFEKALGLPRSKRAGAHNGLGFTLLNLGKLDEAVDCYKKALRINPEDALIHYYWGNALLKFRKPEQAVEQYRKVLEINPRFALAHNQWGYALGELGKPDEAIGHYEMAMEIDAINQEAPNNLAWLLATSPQDNIRDAARAVELAERACEASHYKIPGMLDTLAAAYAEAGRFPEAVAAINRALDLLTPRQELVAEELRRRRELYQAGKPYREQPQGEGPEAGRE